MSSKRSCFATPVSTLLPVLLRYGDFSVAVMRTLVLLLTLKGVAPLVSISKEIYMAKIILFQAPKEWINNDEVRMMFSAMLGTTESEWKRRIDTSLVETLMLGVNRENERHKTNIVILTWFRSLENKFPNLLSLNLSGCINLTDASVSEVARRCSKLHTLNLSHCGNYITDASVSEVARRCSKLHTLILRNCGNYITDASVLEVASAMFESPHTHPRRLQQNHRCQRVGSSKTMFESPHTRPRMVQQHHRRQRVGSSKTMFESPNTQPLCCMQNHRRQRVGSSKTMFESPNTQPRRLQQHHRLVGDGSSKTMFESPHTQPQQAAGTSQTASVSEVARRCSNLQHLVLWITSRLDM